MMRIYFYILFFLLFCASPIKAQDPYFYPFNKAKGLPSNTVYDAFQDSKGFIWFGTAAGITRYDGNIFQKFESNSIKINSCSNINEDLLQRIWFQDFSGNIFYIQKDSIHKFEPNKANGFIRFKFIKDRLFIVSKKGVEIYNIYNFEHLKSIEYPVKTAIQAIVSNNRYYIIGSHITSISYDGIVQNLNLPINYKEVIKAPITAEYKNNLYIFSKFGKSYYIINNQRFTKETLPFDIEFIQNATIIKNEMWLCSTSGLYNYNLKSKKHNHLFKDYNVSYIIPTQNEKHWICTLNEGVLYIDNLKTTLYKTDTEAICLHKDQNDIYFGNMKDEVYKLSNKAIIPLHKNNSKHSVYQIFKDSTSNSLFYTSSKFQIQTPNKEHTSVFPVKQIAKLDNKYFAYASSMGNGVLYINKHLKSEYDSIFLSKDEIIEDGIHFIPLLENEAGRSCAFNPKDKTIYFVTNYGIRIFKNNAIEEIIADNINFSSIQLLNDQIYCLTSDHKLLILENGLQPIHLPSSITRKGVQLIKALHTKLGILSGSSVYEFDPLKKTTIKLIDISEEGDCNDIEVLNGNYYFSTYDGIIKMESKANATPSHFKLFINDIFANNNVKTPSELLQLNHQDNNIEIHFSVLTESPNTNYKLYYRINNQRWEEIESTARVIKLSSLANGQYEIEIKVSLDQYAVIKEIQLNITDPFWSTWWFTVILFLVFSALVYTIYRFQIKRIYQKNRQELEKVSLEKNLNQSKLKAIKSQMNPHFFFNALNTLQSYILSNDKKQALHYLSRFSQLTRTFLEMSDKDFITLAEEINTLEMYLDVEKGRFEADFDYEILVSKSIAHPEDIRIPSVLLQPFVENAIKHGLLHKQGLKHLSISFTLDAQYLTVVINDNGIGRKRSYELNKMRQKNHNSFATDAMNRRIDLLNSYNEQKITLEYIDKYDQQNLAVGTKVIINIPINH